MTFEEFQDFLDKKSFIEWQPVRHVDGDLVPANELMDSDGIAFRVPGYLWYDNHPENCTYVTRRGLQEMTTVELWSKLIQGLNVEGITRITGYFSKVNSWNGGKLAELRDRNRGFETQPGKCGISFNPMHGRQHKESDGFIPLPKFENN